MFRLCESPSTSLKAKSSKTLSGLFAECDKLNQNERIYPNKVYLPALNDILPKIREGRLLGELDHPNDRDEVCLSNVSHVIKDCKVEGNKVYGTVELLDTPAGKIAQALVEAGIPLGISSRGVGNTRRVNEGDEVTDLKLITYDLVADPSFSNAVLSESTKIKLISRLDDVASTLPLNESVGNSSSFRSKINDIKANLEKAPSVTSELVETVGTLTVETLDLKAKLSESNQRNKSLKDNMSKLQDSYNLLSESVVSLEKKKNSEIKAVRDEVKSIRESYESQVSSLNEEVVTLRKQLAIEKRGLSCDTMMPILEGLTEVDEINSKLDSVKQLNARRYSTSKAIENLTEGTSVPKSRTKLSRIVSSV